MWQKWFPDWLFRRKRMAVAAYFPNDPTRMDRSGVPMDWKWVLQQWIALRSGPRRPLGGCRPVL